jgi:hypothetical protein
MTAVVFAFRALGAGAQPDKTPASASLSIPTAATQVETEWLIQETMRQQAPAQPAAGRGKGAPRGVATKAQLASWPVHETIARGLALAARRTREGVRVDDIIRALDAASARAKILPPQADDPARRDLYLQTRGLVRRLVLTDPLLNFDKLLFLKRFTYHSSHIYTDYFDGSGRMGGNLCVLSPVAPDGKVTDLFPSLNSGIFGRYDLSFDARRIAFAYKKDKASGYRIYSANVDGTGLRQLTHDGADEPEMIRQFGHGYDDLDPCYLPDGRIAFASTRAKRAVICVSNFTSTAMHVMDADGKNLRCLSGNTVNEFTPVVMDDGRVLYTRWEYVDKGAGDVQSLWAMHPDGSHSVSIYKNNVSKPPTLIDGRCIPGSRRLVATGAPHMPLAVGPIVLIDCLEGANQTPSAMTNITPEIAWPTHGGYPSARMGFYKEPWPLSEDLFLVAYHPGPRHSEPAGYALYLLDAAGNRELVYRDPGISCFQPTPLRLRPIPPVIPSAIDARPEEGVASAALGTLVLQDVYEGLSGISRGRVKYVRVMEDVPKPWGPSACAPKQGDSLGLQNPAISLKGHFVIKRLHGIVPIESDGSASFTAPAGKNLYFQALDENFMELQRMRTFVNLMPGETRACVGCHEPRHKAPPVRPAVAALRPARPLAFQPGDSGPRTIHYARDVQPTLDKYCVRCHAGAQPQGGLDLSGELTQLFNRSYENLIKRKLLNHVDSDPRDNYIPVEPPLTFGSHRSRVIERVRGQTPCAVPMAREEFIRLVTWIDANAPYYGLYEGKRNIKWKGDPEFRPDPIARQ